MAGWPSVRMCATVDCYQKYSPLLGGGKRKPNSRTTGKASSFSMTFNGRIDLGQPSGVYLDRSIGSTRCLGPGIRIRNGCAAPCSFPARLPKGCGRQGSGPPRNFSNIPLLTPGPEDECCKKRGPMDPNGTTTSLDEGDPRMTPSAARTADCRVRFRATPSRVPGDAPVASTDLLARSRPRPLKNSPSRRPWNSKAGVPPQILKPVVIEGQQSPLRVRLHCWK
jgi:hypothetical protein